MNRLLAPLPLSDVPPDVLDFAAGHDLVGYLKPVLNVTRTAFPTAPLRLYLEDDPETPDDRHIVVEADVTGWDAEAMLAARNRWSELLFQVCSPRDVCNFRIRLAQSP